MSASAPESSESPDAQPFASLAVDAFLESVAAKSPTPGGGAVAAIIGAHGAALGQMVVNYTIGSKKYAEHERMLRAALKSLADARAGLLTLADRDAAAYAHLSSLWKRDPYDPAQAAAFADAVRAAIDAPSRIVDRCLDVLATLEGLCGVSNRMLRSDLAIAADVTATAARSAAWNVRINLSLLEDDAQATAVERDLAMRLETAAQRARAIDAHCRS